MAKTKLKEDELFAELVSILKGQERPDDEVDVIREAFEYARKHHDGQLRKNNENYIVHPVSVAIILAKIPVDSDVLAAALMHDVLEDTEATDEEMKEKFGDDILKLVQGVTKLGKFEFASKEDRQAENFRKMFLAMADDVRVIMLKLADRLHNMQTLHHMVPEKQLKTANETLEIFAPLANRMGMGKIRAELEDLSLKYLHPQNYTEIDQALTATQEDRDEVINHVIKKIQGQLDNQKISAKIYGRSKHYYSIYKKIQRRDKNVHEIFDISAVRIIVDSEKECYEVLGIIHNAFKPIPGRFKDYIAMPKSNLYQSLHTTVFGPEANPLEVQIRTEEMHRVAEYGIAAHWRYKESGNSNASKQSTDEEKFSWLKQMIDMKEDTSSAKEYVDSVKLDIFRDEVFVFTPNGKVVVLPADSTPVDFAYRIHTEVGNTCTGATLNSKIVPLNTKLKNGDIVEIITNKKGKPRLDWITFVQTQQAKSRIRSWFKKHYRQEHEERGRRMLEEELGRKQFDEHFKSGHLEEVAKAINYTAAEDMFVALGYGEINLARVVNRLKVSEAKNLPKPDATKGLIASRPTTKPHTGADDGSNILGLEGMVYNIAKCCNPLAGESIVGVVTRNRGVMVHRDDCQNLNHTNPDRLIPIQWNSSDDAKTAPQAVVVDILTIDRMGVLSEILIKVSNTKTNITNTQVNIHKDHTATVSLTIDIENLKHLDRVRQAVMEINDVISVKRQRGRS